MDNSITGSWLSSSGTTSDTSSTSGTTSLRQFADLGLTEEQRTKIRSLISAAKQNGTSATDLENQIENVLTD
ncbi:MAG TPA: hypothetical protein VGN14_19070, partial [Candidatus Elarobacter sp.]